MGENKLHSYPSIYNLGHREIATLFAGPVIIEEKIDGSQFSFGANEEGELGIRSRNTVIYPDAPPKMFAKGVEAVLKIKDALLNDWAGWTFRGEYLEKPHHNHLRYNRMPANHVMIFDVEGPDGGFLSPHVKALAANGLGFETVPLLFAGSIKDPEAIRALIEGESVLGGQKLEGVVIKPEAYDLFGRDKKVIMGKFVSEAFKETQKGAWKRANPGGGDVVQIIGGGLRTPARWLKAVQHVRERNELENDPRDIGRLLKELNCDIEREEGDAIKEALYRWGRQRILRVATAGFADWYKQRLLDSQFEGGQQNAA